MDKSIIIVGGGIIGCSTAYYLSKLGHDNVTLIEAVNVAHAASGRAGGFLALDWCDGQVTGELARRSYHLHSQLSSELGEDTGYRSMNTLSLDVRGGRGGRSSDQYPGWVDGRVSHSEVIGTTDTTAQVHPRLLTQAFINRAVEAGVRLIRDEVTGGRVEDGGVRGVKTRDTGDVDADIVILCMGPWSGAGLSMFGVDECLVDGHRAHSITLQLQQEDRDSIDNTALFLSSLKSPEIYPRPDNTVYMCGGCSSDHESLPADPAQVRVDESACHQIKETAGHVSDALARVSQYTCSACYLPHSVDGVPLIGHVSHVSGLLVAAGHSCWGILQVSIIHIHCPPASSHDHVRDPPLEKLLLSSSFMANLNMLTWITSALTDSSRRNQRSDLL